MLSGMKRWLGGGNESGTVLNVRSARSLRVAERKRSPQTGGIDVPNPIGTGSGTNTGTGTDTGTAGAGAGPTGGTDTTTSTSTSTTTSSTTTSTTTSSTTSTTTSSTTTSTTTSTTSSTTSTSTSSSITSTSTTSTTPTSSPTPTSPSPTPTPPPSGTTSSAAEIANVTPSTTLSVSFSAQTTITSTIVTDVNGSPTTFVAAVPTTLSQPTDSNSTSASKRAIITGSVIGGVAFLAILLTLTIFCKRQNYKKLRVFNRHPRSRSMLLSGEDFDDDVDLGGPPMTQYRDNPSISTHQHSLSSASYPTTPTSAARFPVGATPPPHPATPSTSSRASPHLMGLRASESGSIFREGVWPPPGEGSRFVDPLLSSSSQVNLGRIVDDVMGPGGNNSSLPSLIPPPPRPGTSSSSIQVHRRDGSGASDGSDPFSTPTRLRSTQQSPSSLLLLSDNNRPGSPQSVQELPTPNSGSLFITNPSPASPTTPAPPSSPKPQNWLEREVKPSSNTPGIIEVSMGEAL
ncbi:hypothetical protein ABKN59_002127 [Abortiporus biennis]